MGEGVSAVRSNPGNGERDSKGVKEALNLKDNSRFRIGKSSAPIPYSCQKVSLAEEVLTKTLGKMAREE